MTQATLVYDGKEFPLEVIEGTEGERAIDVQKLRAQTGLDLAPRRLVGAIGGHRAPAQSGHQPFYPIAGVFAVWLHAEVSRLHGPIQFFTRAALPPLPAATTDLLFQAGLA